ncbi:MAG: hypothetical protein K2V38_27060, partial [Gemmataceae bacterium]|nr:hypothetical protein [Gemmataceae bacterium]
RGPDGHGRLVAFVVPTSPSEPPDFERLKDALRRALPSYMVPAQFGLLAHLPTTVSGKLNRKALPDLEAPSRPEREHQPPRDPLEEKLAAAIRKALGCADPVSAADDFFHDLGGDSLRAAITVSHLRDDPATAGLTVRDIYEARTVAELARRAASLTPTTAPASEPAERPPARDRARLATAVQCLWLAGEFVVGAVFAYFAAFHAIPAIWDAFGTFPGALLLPLVGVGAFGLYTAASLAFAVLVKWVLIGRYKPTRARAWGGFYVRNWIVTHVVRLVPWVVLNGTVFQCAALRLLGARIGKRVHIHRGVDLLQGGWDLLDIGDDVTLSQESSLRLVELHAGEVIASPVTLGSGVTLEVRAGVGGDTRLGAGAYLTALSYLSRGETIPANEKWTGVPARPAGEAPAPPALPEGGALSPVTHGLAMLLARAVLGFFVLLPFEVAGLALVLVLGAGFEVGYRALLLGALLVSAAVPLTVLAEGLAARALGRVSPGVISRWSLGYVRVWLKSGLVDAAGAWLSGTLFWPRWLRLAGMKIGRGCEISTIIDVTPELVEIGEWTFFADGIYLGGPRLHQGTVTLRPVKLGANTFLGNHAVVAEGQELPPGVLFGIATVADGVRVPAGTSWFGLPAFELPRREIVEADRSLTHEPSAIRYWNRVVWEVARAGLPVVPFLLVVAWFELLAFARPELPDLAFWLVGVPAVTFVVALAPVLLVVAVKWTLL